MVLRLSIVLALVAIVALPFALRPPRASTERADDTLVIITPHNEALRHEYAIGFREWYRARTGRTVAIDWRVIGGTSEIARFLEGEYVASFRNLWERRQGRPWNAEIQSGFQNGRLPADAPPLVQEARAAFLASEVSCGIDLFFGGGTFDFVRQAQAGRIVDSGMLERHPEWFRDEVIPPSFAGELYWDREGRWIGSVLSAYGIIYNRDALGRLGITQPPAQWDDLKDPRLWGEVALADPTKSGSIAKAFENVIQLQMQRRWQALQASEPGATPASLERRAVAEGWIEGLRLLQLIGANARYFTDSSQKPPIDVAAGNCAVGMCIDFYGRQQEEAVRRRNASSHLGYVSPRGGTVSSVDPVALLRGAPHRDLATQFIEYVLSMEGQKLWNFRPGTPGGPQRFALRRLPVRKDFYTLPGVRELRSDPDENPFEEADPLVYRAGWTGGLFREMAFIIRVMCLDTHPELSRAWRVVSQAGEPPEALAALQDLSLVDYERAGGAIRQALSSRNKVDELHLARDLGNAFRRQYRRAEELASRSRQRSAEQAPRPGEGPAPSGP